ncbi:Metallo-dependent phosphatase-like protein [Butyriboletus roseoflavus]|nr:Metallo-dependent phosphatase-like protein [Butyriboletus roseoflavus]
MAFSCGHLFRLLNALFAPAAAIVGFACLLTFVFILYQPTPGPGVAQQLGWQSWDAVTTADYFQNGGQVTDPGSTPQDQSSGLSSSTDWWNVTMPEDDSQNYPTDTWMPLWPHDTGLSEIAITRCFVPPELVGRMCEPETTIEQDAIKGNWVRVDRDLNKESGVWTLNIYYRRTRRLDIPLITDMRLLPTGELPTPPTDLWVKVEHSIRDGVMRAEPLYLWYKTGKTMQEMSVEDKDNIITEIDVLFGEDRTWYGFEKLEPPVTPEQEGRMSSVYVTYRKGVKPVPRAPPLHFSNDGRFRILQVADLHYSVSRGVCRDTVLDPCVASDNLTNSLLGHVLDLETPDLVVFTGDQLNGQGTSWDPKSVLAKFAAEVTDRKIPWAAVFGNHDEENGDVKAEQLKMMQALPYSLVERGPKDIHGVGNYVLKVRSADRSMTHLLTLYFLDSGAYSKGTKLIGSSNNLAQLIPLNARSSQTSRPTLETCGIDNSDQITPTMRKLAKPNALMFFHIPLQESYGTPDTDSRTGQPLDIGLHELEGPGSAKNSDGMFDNGLTKALESQNLAAGVIPEVKVVANGHCHITEDCKRVQDVWLCFGGGGSYSGYGKVGFDRRFRVYDISDYGETIKTYKRSEHDEVLDEFILAGRGAAPYNGQA